MSDLKLGAPDCLEKHSEIKQTVASVKAQEDQLMDRLTNEQICLERELQIGKVFNPNKQCGLSHPYQLDESILIFRGIRICFSFF